VADLCVFMRSLAPAEPVLFVGLGSNLLVRDGGFPGAVVFTHHALTGIAQDESAARRARVSRRRGRFRRRILARFVAKHGGGRRRVDGGRSPERWAGRSR